MATITRPRGSLPHWQGTYSEVVELSKTTPRVGEWCSESETGFYGDTLADTLRKAVEGDPDITTALVDAQTELFKVDRTAANNYLCTDDGGLAHYFDVAAAIDGDPEYWRVPQETFVHREEVRVYVNGAVTGDVSPANITRRGAVVAELVSRLMVGGPVKLYWCYHNTEALRTVEIPLDRGQVSRSLLAFILAHPGMQRRLGFMLLHVIKGGMPKGYGAAQRLSGIPAGPRVITFDHHAEGDRDLLNWESNDRAKIEAAKYVKKVQDLETSAREGF